MSREKAANKEQREEEKEEEKEEEEGDTDQVLAQRAPITTMKPMPSRKGKERQAASDWKFRGMKETRQMIPRGRREIETQTETER
jgi:hypothetical protein